MQFMAGIEQQPQADAAFLGDVHPQRIAELVVVGNRAHRALIRFQHLDRRPSPSWAAARRAIAGDGTALIGVNASSEALIGRIGPCTDRL